MTCETISDTFLYNLTLEGCTAIVDSIVGRFSSLEHDEILINRGKSLELMKPDRESGRLVSIGRWECFSYIRSIAAVRLTGSERDYLVMGSESGKLSIAEWSSEKNGFVSLKNETFGKSGTRRVVPGEYVRCDPEGRAVMVAAVEQRKFVFIVNRSGDGQLTVASPLEAHKKNTVVFDVCAVHVGWENPLFACLEIDYESDKPTKMLILYEVDLGLNHVSRRLAEPVRPSANLLIPVPRGGVLVCSDGIISYHSLDEEDEYEPLFVKIPRRKDWFDEDDKQRRRVLSKKNDAGYFDGTGSEKTRNELYVTCFATHKDLFLIETELGDLYQLTLIEGKNDEHNADDDDDEEEMEIVDLELRYFETLPRPGLALCLLRGGYLFSAADSGDDSLITIDNLTPAPMAQTDDDSATMVSDTEQKGDEDESSKVTVMDDSIMINDDEKKKKQSSLKKMKLGILAHADVDEEVYFRPHSQLKNLTISDTLVSRAPCIKMCAKPKNAESSYLYALCGKGNCNSASLRRMEHGLSVTEVVKTRIPEGSNGVWSLRKDRKSKHHSLIVMSFEEGFTKVLSVGTAVQETDKSGLNTKVSTIHAAQVGYDTLVQAYSRGLRFISGTDGSHREWIPPSGKRLVLCSTNQNQILVCTNSDELFLFEMDSASQALLMNPQSGGGIGPTTKGGLWMSEKGRMKMEETVWCVAVAPLRRASPLPGSNRGLGANASTVERLARFCAVALDDETVRIYQMTRAGDGGSSAFSSSSLSPSLMSGDVRFVEKAMQVIPQDTRGKVTSLLFSWLRSNNDAHSWRLYLFIGTESGTEISVCVDSTTGVLSNKREFLLGTKPVRHFQTNVRGECAVLSTSSRSWMYFHKQGRLHRAPLCYDSLKQAADFSFQWCVEGVVALAREADTVQIFCVDRIEDTFRTETLPLRHTPRDWVWLPNGGLVIAESDHRCDFNASSDSSSSKSSSITCGKPAGLWSSCLRVIDPRNLQSFSVLPLSKNEAAFAMCAAVWNPSSSMSSSSADPNTDSSSSLGECVLMVASAVDYQLYPRKVGGPCYLSMYRLNDQMGLELIQRTLLDDLCLSLTPIGINRLLVGVGPHLRMYRLGKKKALRRAQITTEGVMITKMTVVLTPSSQLASRIGGVSSAAAAGSSSIMRSSVVSTDSSVSSAALMSASGFTGAMRIFFTDATGGIHVASFDDLSEELRMSATDRCSLPLPRNVSSMVAVDYDTVVLADKFGNIAVSRMTESTGAMSGRLLTDVCQFYIGEMVTSINKCRLSVNSEEVLVYSTMNGTIGAMIPFRTKSALDFFEGLQSKMDEYHDSLTERIHKHYRSTFAPLKGVIDGDLCEQFSRLSFEQQSAVAEELTEDHPSDVLRRVAQLRSLML